MRHGTVAVYIALADALYKMRQMDSGIWTESRIKALTSTDDVALLAENVELLHVNYHQ